MTSETLFRVGTLVIALEIIGCRSVWVHEDWYEGRFEEDYNACRAREADDRAAFLTRTREEICEDTGDGRRICREVIRGGVRDITPWKFCMVQRGWTTEVGSRSDAISKPKSEPGTRHGGGKW